ncbi:hypothetical protein [Streptomyces sp. AF1A]|jgi:hypothetical protein|uniref:hypothetical protein n=1 Tax=Streptomyces sp. AF1A TaxID=3394350 RepID=UPI0039BC4B96
MAAQREQEHGHGKGPVPRDLPDQQARADDPWDAAPGPVDDPPEEDEVPDTDEAGTGPRGAPRSGTVHPEHPAPDEPSG